MTHQKNYVPPTSHRTVLLITVRNTLYGNGHRSLSFGYLHHARVVVHYVVSVVDFVHHYWCLILVGHHLIPWLIVWLIVFFIIHLLMGLMVMEMKRKRHQKCNHAKIMVGLLVRRELVPKFLIPHDGLNGRGIIVYTFPYPRHLWPQCTIPQFTIVYDGPRAELYDTIPHRTVPVL